MHVVVKGERGVGCEVKGGEETGRLVLLRVMYDATIV